MADEAALQDHVVAQQAFAGSAEPLNRFDRTFIARIGLELHADTAQRLENVSQQQVFTIRVDRRALESRVVPRPADLQPAVCRAILPLARWMTTKG